MNSSEAQKDDVSTSLSSVITSKLDWIIAGLIATVLFLIYFLTASRWAFPGESAHLIAMLTEARPNVMLDHGFWQRIMGWVARLAGPTKAVEATTIINMLFATLSLGFTYLVTTAVFVLFIEKRDLDPHAETWTSHSALAARLGGIVTTLALASSAPFWVAASRVNLHSIYLLWILLSTYLMLRFLASGNTVFFYSFCLLYGMGMSQSTVMIQFAPVFILVAIVGMIRSESFNFLTGGLGLCLLGIGFTSMFLFSIYAFVDTPGYMLQGYWGKSLVAEKMISGLASQLLSSLPRNGWLIIIGLVILPWISWLIVAARTLNGESGTSIQFLNGAIFIVTLAVILDTRISPWQFFGFSSEQIVSYTMASMTLGYCVTAAYMYTVNLLSVKTDSPTAQFSSRILRGVLVAVIAIILTYEVKSSVVHAETRNTKFILTYVDRLIENLDGRAWIVTDGVFDDMILLRGMERGLSLNMLDLRAAGNQVYTQQLREKISSARLRNSLDIGIFSFLQEWISTDPDVSKHLVLCLFPDLWTIGDFRIYPRGLAFFGGNTSESSPAGEIAKTENIQTYFALMDELDIELDAVSMESSRYVLALADSVRRRVSFIGNNLGYFIETLGNKDEAMGIYARVHAFDPQNVSAMLNYAFLLEQFGTEEQKEEIRDKITTFRKTQSKPLHIWELSRTQGYVNSPEAFAYLGWTWALSGQSTIAIKTLGMAIGNDYATGELGIMATLADVHSRRGDRVETEKVLEAILKETPNDLKTIISLAQIKMLSGDTEAADTLLKQAREIGIPESQILREEASLKMSVGDYDGAQVALQKILEESPKDADAHLSLYMTHAKHFLTEKNNERQAEIRSKMMVQIDELFRIQDARFFQGAIAQGHFHLIDNKLEEARENFLMANKTMPGIVPILELVLRLDYALKDPSSAQTHAKELLQIAPDHSFSNYIMGSIALTKGEYESAEAYLQRSVERDANILATGDLAYVKFRLEDFEKAFELVTQALDRSKELYEVWDTYGLILLQQQKYAEAETAFRTALRLNVQNPIVHLHLARALNDQGRKQDSRNILEEIQTFETSLYGEEKRYYETLWRDVFGQEGLKESMN